MSLCTCETKCTFIVIVNKWLYFKGKYKEYIRK